MRIARTSGLTALALTSALLVTVGTPGAAHAEDAVAGGLTASPADSLFPNQGNSGYDVSHYDINFKADFTPSKTANAVGSSTVSDATTTITATTTGAPLSSFSLDFQGSTGNLAASTFNIDSVTVNGAPATFSRIENTVGSSSGSAANDVHKLIITPATPVDGAFTAVVKYSGKPVAHTDTDGSSEGWNNTTDGATFLNQPVGAMTLYPNNNTPRDKATYTFTVDIPSQLSTSNYAQAGGKPYKSAVVSNGELVSTTPSADGSRTTWVWDQTKPMASELALVSIGRYDMYHSDITLASGRTIPEWTFIDPAIATSSQTTTLTSRARLKQILDFFESKYGPYPGNSAGLVTDVVPSAINYALETQDRSFFPTSASLGTTYHEVMHQWFGDNVTPVDWNDIWLNEGPATYAESQLPFEGAGSTTTTTETAIYNKWNSAGTTSAIWATPVAAMTNAEDLFGSPTYSKGVMTLEALRTSIGAADFAELMNRWQTQYAGTSKRTADFIALAEEISGRDLTAFFNTWIYTTGKPAWPVKFNLNLAGPTATVNPGDTATYTLSVRNTGKVAMPADGTKVTVDLADVLDDATLGDLPAGVTVDGTTLTWSVPATALATTSSVDLPVTLKADTTGRTLKAVARAATLGGTCLDCSPTTVVGTAPIAPAPTPTITGLTGGAPVVGQALTADTTGWADGTAFTYRWMIDGTPVAGATGPTYTPTGDVVGLPVTVEVTGTLAGFNATSATSAATAVGVRATPASATPTISGTPKIGERLTVDPGTWQPGEVFTYQWRANGTNISGATGPSYTPAVATQVGQTLDVVVTGTKFGYTTTAQTSAATAAVADGDALVATPTPELTGTPKVGTAFVPNIGTWDDGVTLTFQWAANGTNVTGSAGTGAVITPTVAQAGQTLTLTVTGTKPGMASVVRTSNTSTAIANGTQVLQPTPTVTGTVQVDSALTGVPGTWDSGTTLAYQWSADGTAIAGATTTSYTPGVAQIGKALTFSVTSTKAGYDTVTKTSVPSTVLGYTQTLTPTPTISGTPVVGATLTADAGTWDSGVALAYQWKVDGTPVSGATARLFQPTVSMVGKVITVSVTGSKTSYETVTTTSEPTEAVAEGTLASTPVPTIDGTPKVGVELTAVPGDWDTGTSLAYQWSVAGTPVPGATSATFTPGVGDLGKTVTVAVTGSKSGFATVTRSSAATAEVAKGDLVSAPVPTITGDAQVGHTLTAVPGIWADDTTLAYQWSVDGDEVDGATEATYTLTAADLARTVTVTVTGTKAGYEALSRTSLATTAVEAGDLTATPVPTVGGVAQVGKTLTATAGTWDEGTTLGYRWLRNGSAISGAIGSTYVARPGDLGARISVVVTGVKAGYVSVSRTSAARAVAAGVLVKRPTPRLTGAAKVGRKLTVAAASYDAGVTVRYTWFVRGKAVKATGRTLKVTSAFVGKKVWVHVTISKPGYTTVTLTSAKTAEVKR